MGETTLYAIACEMLRQTNPYKKDVSKISYKNDGEEVSLLNMVRQNLSSYRSGPRNHSKNNIKIAYLISRIFPENTFSVVKAIKENPHYLTNTGISTITGIYGKDLVRAISWLLEHKVIRQDSRSVRAGHQITDAQAYFYTVDGHCGRGLTNAILENMDISEEFGNVESSDNANESGNAEGARHYAYASRIERNHRNRVEAIRLHGYKCQACGFDFAEVYGELGRNYIEVHHINPLADQDGDHIVNPATDLVCLCANCHRMVHRNKNQVLPVSSLRDILRENLKGEK